MTICLLLLQMHNPSTADCRFNEFTSFGLDLGFILIILHWLTIVCSGFIVDVLFLVMPSHYWILEELNALRVQGKMSFW